MKLPGLFVGLATKKWSDLAWSNWRLS